MSGMAREGNVRMRLMVGDLELNLAGAMLTR